MSKVVVHTCTHNHVPAEVLERVAKGALKFLQRDPTRTTTLRNRFVTEMRKRFRGLRGAIRKAIVDEDVFGLMGNVIPINNKKVKGYVFTTPGGRAFDFPRNEQKLNAFMDWLHDQERNELLNLEIGPRLGPGIERGWTNLYIRSAYQEGIRRSRSEMRKAGYDVPDIDNQIGGIQGVFNVPVHTDRVGVLFTRTFSDLRGITNQMDTQISRVLAQGLIDGRNPRELARQINAVIGGGRATLDLRDTLGRFIPAERRAVILARTEIIRAHHLGNIQEMKNFGVAGVTVKAEWVTAGDERVCPECLNMEGRVFTIEEIEPLIPLHPQCRCMALPIEAEVSRGRR
jgi:SPP1 gp7 family putative phage head morphogenesis protein